MINEKQLLGIINKYKCFQLYFDELIIDKMNYNDLLKRSDRNSLLSQINKNSYEVTWLYPVKNIGTRAEVTFPESCSIQNMNPFVDGKYIVDLDYEHDSQAEVDLNLVLNDKYEILEIQGTAEKKPFTKEDLDQLFEETKKAVNEIFEVQKN